MSIAHADGTLEGSPARRAGGAGKRAHRNVVESIALNEGSAARVPPSSPGPERGASGTSPEVQQASAEAYEEEIMRLSREFNDRWLVVKAYKDKPASTDGKGASMLMKILEGTEAEQREALQSIVARPQPLSRIPKAAPPRVAATVPEPEPERELAPEASPTAPTPMPHSAAALSAWAGAAAGAARDLLAPVVSLAATQVPAPATAAEGDEPLERSHSAEQQDMAKQYWQYNLSEDRNATLSATFCCHCVVAGAPAASECSALVFFAEGDSAEIAIVRESAVVGGDEPEGVEDQIGRHPLFELCKVVRGDSDQYLRLEFERGGEPTFC